MRIIKTHGPSVVIKERNKNKLIRKLIPDGKPRQNETEASEDIGEYLSSNEKFFLAQWGSVLDKMFSKPNPNYDSETPFESVYKTRQKAGNAFMALWEKKEEFSFVDCDSDIFYNKWLEYIHPYGEHIHRPDDKDKPAKLTKGWFTTITGLQSIEEVNDWQEDVAEAVYQHLYKKQKKLTGKNFTTYTKGLIDKRTDSIKRNVRKYQITEDGQFYSRSQNDQRFINNIIEHGFSGNWEEIKNEYQLEKLCVQLEKLEKDKLKKTREREQKAREKAKTKGKTPPNQLTEGKVPYISRQDSIACLNAHYASVFGEDTPVSGIKDNHEAKIKALWSYHCMIREALYRRYPKRSPGNKTKRGLYPLTENKLHHLSVKIELNRMMGFAIRLGKTIHYEAARQSIEARGKLKEQSPNIGKSKLDQKKISALDLLQQDNTDELIANSGFWTSLGQTEIKQKESFVRHWLSTITVANTTLERLIDPTGSILKKLAYGDFTTRAFKSAIKEIEGDPYLQIELDNQCQLIFGKDANHKLYNANAIQRIEFIKALRETLTQIRNASFHYKNIEVFIDALEESADTLQKTSSEITENILNYISTHQKIRRKLLIESLQSAHVEYFLKDNQISLLIDLVSQKKEENLLTFPRFNRFLQRAVDIRESIIEPADLEKNNKPAYHCSFIILKKLYETDFSQWLEKQSKVKLREYANKAIHRTELAAKNLSGTETKMSRLRRIENDESLHEYFSYIARESAKEAALQQSKNRYESNEAGAKEHSNFVDNFKQDFLIFSFHDYVADRHLQGMGDWLKQLSKKSHFTLNGKNADIQDIEVRKTAEIKTLTRPWIYMMLHLVPIEFVNHLSLQIKKQHVLTGKGQFRQINQAISLYLDVHDAVLGLSSLSDEEELAVFYKNKADFEKRFKVNDREEALIPVRGLREILRFGNIETLCRLFDTNKVSPDELTRFNKMQNNIAGLQKSRTEKHGRLARKRFINHQDKTEYKELNDKVIEYRELKNKIYLHNPKQMHQLITSLIGRMISYIQLYERDIYFVLLTLFFLKRISVDKSGEDKQFYKHIKNGQIITAVNSEWFKKQPYKRSKVVQSSCNELRALFSIDDNRETRNHIAHINYLRPGSGVELAFTEIANQIRKMMAYDRKLKNAVAKSLIDMLERHNLIVRFNMAGHQLVFAEVKPHTIYHFGKKNNIPEKLHSLNFVEVIEKLF